MASIEQYSGEQIPHILMSEAGTGGDLIYVSTGSGARMASSTTGTDNSSAFLGVLINNTAAGSYGAVDNQNVVKLEKLASTNKIEIGDIIYADGAAADNKVGTVAGGTAIGVCMDQSSITDTYVSVRIIPSFAMGVSGFKTS